MVCSENVQLDDMNLPLACEAFASGLIGRRRQSVGVLLCVVWSLLTCTALVSAGDSYCVHQSAVKEWLQSQSSGCSCVCCTVLM